MTSTRAREQVVSLIDEIETDARIAAKSLPAAELPAWIQAGTVPLMARAAWSDANAIAERLLTMGERVDVKRVFHRTMGMRAFSILMDAVGERR